jgi:hypothetical protein
MSIGAGIFFCRMRGLRRSELAAAGRSTGRMEGVPTRGVGLRQVAGVAGLRRGRFWCVASC